MASGMPQAVLGGSKHPMDAKLTLNHAPGHYSMHFLSFRDVWRLFEIFENFQLFRRRRTALEPGFGTRISDFGPGRTRFSSFENVLPCAQIISLENRYRSSVLSGTSRGINLKLGSRLAV